MKVTSEQVTEYEPHRFSAEASELGLRPGEWPQMIETDMGNGHNFCMVSVREDGGRYYTQIMGCISLVVFND